MSPKDTTTKPQKSQNRNSLYLLYNLISKDFKIKYRRSVLGVVWSMLNPLLMMLVMSLVFSNIFRFDFDQYAYAAYIIMGQVFFTLFSEGTTGSLRSIIDAAPLIKKIRVNKIIFPTEKVLFALVNFLFSLIAVECVLLFFGIMPTWKLLALPVLVALLIVFSLGLSYFISALTVFFRDIEHLWGVLTTLWFYLTPIFWPYEALQVNGIEWIYSIIQYNPMYHFVNCFRQIMTGIPLTSDVGIAPELIICAIFAGITFIVGFFTFKKLEKRLILYI